jgi:hypothetical protein
MVITLGFRHYLNDIARKGAASNPIAIGELFIRLKAWLYYALIGLVKAAG